MNARSVWAAMPVKPFDVAKRRLMPVLSRAERAELARLMLEDVLGVLAASPVLRGVIVITRDVAAGRIARASGARVLDDPACDLNAAVRAAGDFISRHGGSGMIVVPSDIPLLPSRLIGKLVDRISPPRAVALVPATHDGGTNLLACSPVDAIGPSFGPNSFRRHCGAARDAGILPAVLTSEKGGLDIDRAQDLAALLAIRSAARSRAFLATLEIGARLQRVSAGRDGPRQSLNV